MCSQAEYDLYPHHKQYNTLFFMGTGLLVDRTNYRYGYAWEYCSACEETQIHPAEVCQSACTPAKS